MDIIRIALSQYGVIELGGPENSPEVMKYFHETGRTWVNSDETPWCDAFVDWCAMMAGYSFSPGLNARGWLDEGEMVLDFKIGDIAVLWRDSPDSWKGHVGFPVRKNDKHIWLLGGNQSNMVRISPYPIDRLLGYRRLSMG